MRKLFTNLTLNCYLAIFMIDDDEEQTDLSAKIQYNESLCVCLNYFLTGLVYCVG